MVAVESPRWLGRVSPGHGCGY